MQQPPAQQSPYGKNDAAKSLPPANQQQPAGMKPRPLSEDVSRFPPPPGQHQAPHDPRYGAEQPRPINMQHGARSSPSLAGACGHINGVQGHS